MMILRIPNSVMTDSKAKLLGGDRGGDIHERGGLNLKGRLSVDKLHLRILG
jgi:hypothetical protein